MRTVTRALIGALAALAAAVAVSAAILPTAALAATSGSVTGTVTDSVTHAGVSSVFVAAYDASDDFVTSAVTDASGKHARGSPGRYEIQFFPSDDHIQQYHNGRATLSSADPVTVVSGAATTNVDAALVQRGIAGKITDAVTQTQVADVEVSEYCGALLIRAVKRAGAGPANLDYRETSRATREVCAIRKMPDLQAF